MGCTAAKDGLAEQFFDEEGNPEGMPLYGRYALLFGALPDQITGGVRTDDEKAFGGSEDWITLVGVADSQERLDQIVEDWRGSCNPCQTSCSSHRVTVDLRIGPIQQVFENRVAIASGPILTIKPSISIDVVHVKVLAEGTTLTDLQKKDPNHPLVIEFKGASIALQNL
jgi:hypothetical protein